MKTKKKAISLIVLVVTIIVLAILAATVIVTITNSGIINRATDTVKEYDLSEVRSLANLAWAEALMDENVRTDAEYDAYVKQQLTNAGVNIGDYNIGATSSGVLVTLRGNQSETEYAGLTITADTEGFTFIPVDGVEVTDERIANLQAGDKVVYGDYTYCYNGYWVHLQQGWMYYNAPKAFWGVSVNDRSKQEYGELCGNILGVQVTFLLSTFEDCDSLTEAPVIPSSVTAMISTFEGCTSLEEAPVIPSSVTSMSRTFYGCTSLTEAPVIPSSVTDMGSTFEGCTSLTEAPVIPSSVTDMGSTFKGCTSLEEAPVIPSSVTDMSCTFQDCTSLEEAPVIPSSVTNMSCTFYGCTSLTGELKINSELVENMSVCFYGVSEDLTVKVPADSTTYTTITTADLGSNSITIETFVPQTVTP